MKGKAYAHKSGNRPGDSYPTPKSLVWVAERIIKYEFTGKRILEPCAGKGSISTELEKYGYSVLKNDLYDNMDIAFCSNFDYLKLNWYFEDYVITNPPFSLWDEFVMKAKTHCRKFMFIGRLNYLSTQSRLKNGIWNGLKEVYPFSRYVDYQTPFRNDGLFHVGAMATGWFLWDMEYKKDYWTQKILDVQKYAKLGNVRK